LGARGRLPSSTGVRSAGPAAAYCTDFKRLTRRRCRAYRPHPSGRFPNNWRDVDETARRGAVTASGPANGRRVIEPTYAAGTPSLLRAINERSALEAIRRSGPVSRADVARETGLSKPTVSLALAGLTRAGLVREVGRTIGGKGPSAIPYELNPLAGGVVGIDVGREYVRAAIADIAGTIVARRDERARARSAASLIGQIGAVAHSLAGEAGLGWRQVTQAAIGSPGVLDPERGAVALAANLPGWGRQG